MEDITGKKNGSDYYDLDPAEDFEDRWSVVWILVMFIVILIISIFLYKQS